MSAHAHVPPLLGHVVLVDFVDADGTIRDQYAGESRFARSERLLQELLSVNVWALGGTWRVEREKVRLVGREGHIACRFHARPSAPALQLSCAYHRRVTVDVVDVDVPAAEPTTRRRKREQVRARVERVALDLFRQHGFEQVTVERIAAEAGVGATTFYRYFGTKDGVLFGYQSRWLQDVRLAVDGLDVGRSRAEQIRDLLTVLAGKLDAELDTMQMRDEIVARNPTLLPHTLAVQRVWEQELARSLARRREVEAGDLDVLADAAAVQFLVRLAFRRWRAGASANVTDGVARAVQDMVTLASDCPR